MRKRVSVGEIILLILLIFAPFLIVVSYQSFLFSSQDPSNYQSLHRQASSILTTRRQQNQQQYRIIRDNLTNEKNGSQQIKQSIISKFDELFNTALIMHPLLTCSYYQTNLIINVQLTTGFLSQKSEIRQEILRQIDWFNQQFRMSVHVIQWQSGMNINALKSCLIVIFSELKYDYIEENIGLKLKKGDYRNHYYIQQIVSQLKTLPSFSHCKFMSTYCTQSSLVFVSHNQQKHQTFWQAEDEIYFIDSFDRTLIFNALVSILKMDPFIQLLNLSGYSEEVIQLYQIKKYQSLIYQLQKNLQYIKYIIKPSNFNLSLLINKISGSFDEGVRYLINGQYLSPYIHTQQERAILQNVFQFITRENYSKKIDHDILVDNRVGFIDIFPNDFKIGIYLPLLYIFVYPLFLKLKQGFSHLYYYLRGL